MAYTANFLTVNGLNLPAMSAGRRRSDVDKWGRGNGVDMSGATFARKRQFAFETPPMTPLEAHALSGWVRGLGHHFTFEWLDEHLSTTKFTLYSTDGGAVISGGSTATADTKYGSYALLAAGNDTHTVTALFGSETPHGFSVWRKQLSINTWELCSAAYDGATARYFAGPGGTSITTAFAWTTFLHTTGYLRVGLEGQNAAGSSATCLYDGLMILPYSPTSAQLYARHQRLNTEPGFPLVAVGGHLHQAIPEVAAKGFVKSYPVHQVVLDRPRDNARQVVGTLVESRPLSGGETVLPEPDFEYQAIAVPEMYFTLDDADLPSPGVGAQIHTNRGSLLTGADLRSLNVTNAADEMIDRGAPFTGQYMRSNNSTIQHRIIKNSGGDIRIGAGSFSVAFQYLMSADASDSYPGRPFASIYEQGGFFYGLFIQLWPAGGTYSGRVLAGIGRGAEPLGGTALYYAGSSSNRPDLVDSNWHSCVIVVDRSVSPSMLRVYVDGVETNSTDISTLDGDDPSSGNEFTMINGLMSLGGTYSSFVKGPVNVDEYAIWTSTAINGNQARTLHQLMLDGTSLSTYLGI